MRLSLKSMSRYASEIKTAIEVEKLKGKGAKGLNKQQRAMMMINDFRASMRAVSKSRPQRKITGVVY